MTTAQDGLADLVIRQISPKRDIAAINKFAAGIVEFVSTGSRTLNGVIDPAPASRFAGGIAPFFTHVSGVPWKEYLVIPSTIQSGDVLSLTIDGSIYSITLPAGFSATGTPVQYDGDRISSTIPNAVLVTGAGDELGGPISTVTSGRLGPGQRGLVVYEHQPPTAGGGKMFVISPNQATGIPIPAFRTVTTNPPTGTLVGEAILNTNTGGSFVWDGLKWKSIVPPSIVSYPTDSDVLTDNIRGPGTYAFSQATGNLFVRYTDTSTGASPGTDIWREIGITKRPLQTGLLGIAAADGTIGYAIDTGNFFMRIGTAWQPFGEYKDTQANILASTYADGSRAYATDTGQFWIRENGAWIPFGIYHDIEANIRTKRFADGAIAQATDTGNTWARFNGAWAPNNLYVSSNQAALLLNNWPDGVRAYAADTGNTWLRHNGAWQPLGVYMDTVVNIHASTYPAGTQAYATDEHTFWQRDATRWNLASVLRDTETGILAHDPGTYYGSVAVADDVGKIYMSDGTNWVGQPFKSYATETALLATNDRDGVLAVAVDTGLAYFRTGGNWITLNGNAIPTGATDPASASSAVGNLFYNTTSSQAKVFTATGWAAIGAGGINDLSDVDTKMYPPKQGDTLGWDVATAKWWPFTPVPPVHMGAEPAQATRFNGMLWNSGARTWVWQATPGCWVEV